MHEIGVQSSRGMTSSEANKLESTLERLPVAVQECFLTAHEANHDCVWCLLQDVTIAHVRQWTVWYGFAYE